MRMMNKSLRRAPFSIVYHIEDFSSVQADENYRSRCLKTEEYSPCIK